MSATDRYCRRCIGYRPDAGVAWALMCSYAYYVLDKSIISDGLFDHIMSELLARWDTIQHRHKYLIEVGDLKAGSLYRLREEDYPGIVKSAAKRLLAGG